MSLGGYFDDLLTGQPLGTTDKANASGNAALQAINTGSAIDPTTGADIEVPDNNQYLVDSGVWTPAQGAAATADINTTIADSDPSQVTTAFTSALGSELSNPIGSLWSTWTAWLKSFLGTIPVTLWIVIIIAIFLWLGGGGFVERRARERLSR